uniref:Uncharacterized protein n=1 Tax=Cairina moschata TaxID=8855 RepID=A0A8C3GK49_CAIMO
MKLLVMRLTWCLYSALLVTLYFGNRISETISSYTYCLFFFREPICGGDTGRYFFLLVHSVGEYRWFLEQWAPPVFWKFTLEQLQNPEKLVECLKKRHHLSDNSKETQITAACWGLAYDYRAAIDVAINLVTDPAATPSPVIGPMATPNPAATPTPTMDPAATPAPEATPTPVMGPVVIPASVAGPVMVPSPVTGPEVVPIPVMGPAVISAPVMDPAVIPAPVTVPAVVSTPVAGPVSGSEK